MLNRNTFKQYSGTQLTMLVLLRLAIGWHFLYEGIAKLLNPDWSASSYLANAVGPLSGMFKAMAANASLLNIIDICNEWGLVLIGIGLILGFLTNISTIAGILLLALYYFAQPPLIGVATPLTAEGSYLFVNKILVELFAMAVLLVFPTGFRIGIDRLIFRRNK
jgi:thiosulfate dehydrogenase (quinone) large subunit